MEKIFGRSSRVALGKLLDLLDANHDKFVVEELGIAIQSTLSKKLAWKRISNVESRTKEYELAIAGDLFPPALRIGTQGSMNIRIQLTHETLRLSHDYRVLTDSEQLAQIQNQVQPAIENLLIQVFNPVVAVALQPQIKQRAEQQLHQEQRLQQQQQQLQTVVHQNGMIQTMGTIFAPRMPQGADGRDVLPDDARAGVQYKAGQMEEPFLKNKDIEQDSIRSALRHDKEKQEAIICITIQPGEQLGQIRIVTQYEGKKGEIESCLNGQNDLALKVSEWLEELLADSAEQWDVVIDAEP